MTPAVWGGLGLLYIVWGSTYLGIALMDRTIPPLIGTSVRFACAALILGAAIAVIKGPRALLISKAELRGVATMALGLLVIGIGTLSLAERYVPSGLAALIIAVAPLYYAGLRMTTGDRPNWRTLVGAGVGLVGIALIVAPGGSNPASGTDTDVVIWSCAMLCSSFVWAFVSFKSSRLTLPKNSLVATTWEMLIGAVVLMIVALLLGERFDIADFSGAPLAGWGWLVIASILGYGAYGWVLPRAPISLLSTYTFVNPVVAVFLGWWLAGEAVTRDVVVGSTVVIGAVAFVVLGERRSS